MILCTIIRVRSAFKLPPTSALLPLPFAPPCFPPCLLGRMDASFCKSFVFDVRGLLLLLELLLLLLLFLLLVLVDTGIIPNSHKRKSVARV